MTDKEVMQMALDALEDVDGIDTETECVTIDVGSVIEALRAALAQTEPWLEELPEGTTHISSAKLITTHGGLQTAKFYAFKYEDNCLLVYTTDNDNEYPHWALADKQFKSIPKLHLIYTAALAQPEKTDMQIGLTYEEANPSKHNFEFSTIEEAMQPMPTPTGQPQLTDDETRFANAFIALQKAGYGKEAEIVLKCKRKWVGLTDKEISEGIINSWVIGQAFESAVWWAEEKLKEKNT
jgi:hypothetical protein